MFRTLWGVRIGAGCWCFCVSVFMRIIKTSQYSILRLCTFRSGAAGVARVLIRKVKIADVTVWFAKVSALESCLVTRIKFLVSPRLK